MRQRRHKLLFSICVAAWASVPSTFAQPPAVPSPCPPGKFTNDTINCYSCPPNSYCQDGVLNQCPQYSTSPAESSLITQCACQSDSGLDNGACMCKIGYVRGLVGSVDQCQPCPAGSWCPEQTTVRKCTDNAISLQGSFKAENCSLCASGWLKNGPLSCRRCLNGYACPDLLTEYPCTPGSYAPALATTCVTCSASSYASVNASTTCTPCATNSSSVAGATDEAQCVCSDGYYKLGLTKTCAVCTAGSACSGNYIQQCPAGKSSTAGQGACASCAQGKYQATSGASACASCPAGPNVVIVSSLTELNAPIDRPTVKATSGMVYIMRTFFETSTGKNLTKWSFYAKAPGCAVTPMVFSSPNANSDLGVAPTNYNLVAAGAKRTVTAEGAYTYSFYDDPAQGYLIGVHNFFGWAFDGDACIPYEVPTLPLGQALIPVMEFPYLGGQAYTKVTDVYGDNERWSVQVTSELTQVLPSTESTGTVAVTDCRCPSSTKRLTPSGICQPRCPDGKYMVNDADTVCSPCRQGSYCVDSSIYPCAAGFSSLSGASVCTPCIVPGIASDIALYTCGLKTCTPKMPQPLGTSSWRGLGKLNVGINQYGSLDDYPFTPWAPGSIVVGMELNPASDRPYALLERDVVVVAGKPNAFQFRFRCAGIACVRSFVVQYKESGGQFTEIFTVDTIPSADWVQTSTAFFTPTSGFATVRIVAELQLSSSKVWLSSIETVGMGIWQLDGAANVRLLNTTTVPIAYSTSYTEQDEVSTMRLENTGLVYNVPATTVYPGRTFPGEVIYIVSVSAYGTGKLAIEVEDVNGVVVVPTGGAKNSWDISSTVFAKYVFQLARAPTKVTFRATGVVIIANPSLTLRDQIIGCQSCLANYHCSGQTINACPSNSVSAAGSDEQIDCFCDKGFYGNVNFTVGWSPCSPCPANYYCDGSKAGNHLAFCPNGTKSNLSSWVCSACQIDEYCAFGHVGACPDHSTSPISSWDVTQCICDAGYYGTAPDCKPCEPGSYCTGGKKIACTGNATSTPKSDDPTDCFCDRGYYGVQNTPCKSCEEGSWCWNGIKNACPINMWSPVRSSFQSNCTCTDGSYPSGASCVLCSSGTYKAGKGQVGCIPCPAGTSSMAVGAVDASTCSPCQPGRYSVTPGQYQCQECAAGYYQPDQGSTSCKDCWAGSYSLGKAATCTGCTAGSASALIAAGTPSVCQMCDGGWWSPGNVSKCTMCGVCPYWKFPATVVFQPLTLKAVLTQNAQHFQFAPDSVNGGMFLAMGTSVYHVDLTTGILSQPVTIQFPGRSWWFASLTTSNLGGYLYGVQDRYAFRVDLNMGSWDKNYAAVLPSCIVEDTSRPVAVIWIAQPSGILGMDPVQESIQLFNFPIAGTNYVCLSPTDSDYMYVTGTFGLRKVSKSTGTYTSLLTGTAYTVCSVTPDGIFVILSQATTKTVWSYSLFDTAVLKIASNALVSGLYVDGQNIVLGVDAVGVRNISYAEADSRSCSPGKYNEAMGLVSESQCTACEPGRLCPGGSNHTACIPGTYSPSTGLRQQEQCLTCPAGYYCPGAEVLTVCPLGSFSPATKLVKASDCPLCSENYFCPNTTTQLPCPANTVSLAGSHDLSECTCMPGYRCIIAKVVHAEIVLQMTEAQFTDTVRAKYLAAIAASAGVDVSKVAIVSVQQVSVTGAGGLRRLLGFGTMALEVHTSIYEAPTESLSDLNGHLNRQGLPSYHEVRIFVHNEVVDSVRLGR